MRIGYACIAVGVSGANQRTCIKKNASPDKLAEIIEHNLNALETIIDYNLSNKIFLFRISSGLIPFGSSKINSLNWTKLFKSKFQIMGKKILEGGMRTSMHPGQYTVLNSPNSETLYNSIENLKYHAESFRRFFFCLIAIKLFYISEASMEIKKTRSCGLLKIILCLMKI